MKVTLRSKPISKGRQSLYLDFYPAIPHPETGKLTRREFLGLYLTDKAKNELDKEHNKATKKLAENIKAKRQLEIQSENYGFLKKDTSNGNFLAYFKELAEKHKSKAKGDRNNWLSVYNYLDQFTNGQCYMKNITETFCLEFRDYLQQAKPFRATKKQLANNSAVGYFNIFKQAVKAAHKAELLSLDVSKDVPSIKKSETKREFLTLQEVRLLAKTECDLPMLKNAALFSALTGLRYGDIEKLIWQEVQGDDSSGYHIRFTQEKTQGVETLPISNEAFTLLGEPSGPTLEVFPGLLYSSWQNQKIQEWVYRAGIMKKITFHAFRHTYATIQLSLGTDIYTVSKMLGHRDLHTTQVYAKIVDKSKREAAEKITLGL